MIYNKRNLQLMLEALIRVKNNKKSHYPGICIGVVCEIDVRYSYLFPMSNSVSDFLYPIWVDWEHYSGVPSYPVPVRNKLDLHSVGVAFYQAMEKGTSFSKYSAYGRKRLELLDYLIKRIEDMLQGDI